VNAGDAGHSGLDPGGTDSGTEEAENPALFGFWVFLMSDAVIFALLFATYGVMLPATVGGPTPASEYRIGPTLIETLLLLTSSLTYGLATVAMRRGAAIGRIGAWLGITLILGSAFLALELHDFADMFAHGAFPSRSGYLSAFFALVPLHGLHVLVGSVWLIVMLAQLRVFGVDAQVKINLLRLGLFWHFLDIVWIAIFSVVYLPGMIR
jgi:cytochrome o ubiquinol oxidase subunit 3